MKIKTSVSFSKELLDVIEDFVSEEQNRSSFLEAAAWSYIARLRRASQNDRDVKIINENADRLNEEAMDALEYQVAL